MDSVIVLANSVDGAGIYQGIVFTDTVTQEQFFADEIGLEVLFNNNGDSGNPNRSWAASNTARPSGAPNRSGIYRISIDIQAWATIFTPFNAPYTFDNFTLRVNCPLLEDVAVTNVNSDEGTQGTLTATLADGVEATEVAWFNAFGDQIGTGMSVSVDNPGLSQCKSPPKTARACLVDCLWGTTRWNVSWWSRWKCPTRIPTCSTVRPPWWCLELLALGRPIGTAALASFGLGRGVVRVG